jgi:hypothetical protein
MECPNDPWGVASLQRDRGFEEIRRARAEKGGAKTQDQRKATVKELQAWWDIAGKKEHALAYARQLLSAWQGAIEQSGLPATVRPDELTAIWNKLFGLCLENG